MTAPDLTTQDVSRQRENIDRLFSHFGIDILKAVAVVTMFIDHIPRVIDDFQSPFFYILGRLAFPLFVLTYAFTLKSPKRAKSDSLLFLIIAIVTQPVYVLTLGFDWYQLNILFNFAIAAYVIYLLNAIGPSKIILKCGIILLACMLAGSGFIDYGLFGVIIFFAIYYLRDRASGYSMFFVLVPFSILANLNISFSGTDFSLSHGSQLAFFIIVFVLIFPALMAATIFLARSFNSPFRFIPKHTLLGFYPIHFVALYILSLII